MLVVWFLVARNVNTEKVKIYYMRETKNKERREAWQILNETWTVKEAQPFTLKGFGSRSHSCVNERLNLRLVIKGVYYLLGKTGCCAFVIYGK